MDGIDVAKIYQVQLSDLEFEVSPSDMPRLIESARHYRVFPGQGKFSMQPFLSKLKRAGYQGPVGVEVFSDALKKEDPLSVAMQAKKSLYKVWFDTDI